MNVGIITFHCSYNFGSALQAFALSEIIKKKGVSNSVIDYRSVDYNQYHIIRPLRPWTIPESLRCFDALTRRKQSFVSFLSKNVPLTPRRYSYRNEQRLEELQDYFDMFVCGSDQIWNLDCTNGVVKPFFLSFAGTRGRVAYAASLAHTSFRPKHYTERDKEFIGEQLDRFSAISVREASTVELFQPLTKNNIEVCLDPTLLLDGEDYRRVVAPAPVEGRFVFAYMLEENLSVIRQAEHVAREAGAKVAYVSKKDLHLSVPSINLFGVGPSEFLGLVAEADAVVTNSFHATVFSLLFGVPFQTVSTRNSGSRMRELLAGLGESEHLIEGVLADMPAAADPVSFGPRLEIMRTRSRAFLDRALEV